MDTKAQRLMEAAYGYIGGAVPTILPIRTESPKGRADLLTPKHSIEQDPQLRAQFMGSREFLMFMGSRELLIFDHNTQCLEDTQCRSRELLIIRPLHVKMLAKMFHNTPPRFTPLTPLTRTRTHTTQNKHTPLTRTESIPGLNFYTDMLVPRLSKGQKCPLEVLPMYTTRAIRLIQCQYTRQMRPPPTSVQW
jgi:hypothetical protein